MLNFLRWWGFKQRLLRCSRRWRRKWLKRRDPKTAKKVAVMMVVKTEVNAAVMMVVKTEVNAVTT